MKYNLQIHGCQMNHSDGERVAAVLERVGFECEDDWRMADLVIYVSCSIKQKAEDKIIGHMAEHLKLKMENEKVRIGLTGCMVRKTSVRGDKAEDDWIRKVGALDFVFRVEDLGELPGMLGGLYGQEFEVGRLRRFDSDQRAKLPRMILSRQSLAVSPQKEDVPALGTVELRGLVQSTPQSLGISDKSAGGGFLLARLPISTSETDELLPEYEKGKSDYFRVQPRSSSSFQGLLPIMTGCNKFCTYCIVPYSRGRERSRPMVEIVEEAKRLVESGRTELLLLGQNVNSYGLTNEVWSGSKRSAFVELLRRLNAIDGVKRIRFTSPHPRDMTEEVIDCVSELPNVCEYLHMPLQSGSDRVLKNMNRGYTQEQYLRQVAYIRKRMPRGGLTTDIIVGFCGETIADHLATRKVMELAKFDIAYISQYSQRSGTYASRRLVDDVCAAEKRRRYHELNDDVLMRTSLANNLKYVGEEWEVLVESVEDGNGQWVTSNREVSTGRLRTYRQVQITDQRGKSNGGLQAGDYVMVKITGAREWVLEGEVSQ